MPQQDHPNGSGPTLPRNSTIYLWWKKLLWLSLTEPKSHKKNTLQFTSSNEMSQLKTKFGSSITVSVNGGFPTALKRIGAADDVDKMPSWEDQKWACWTCISTMKNKQIGRHQTLIGGPPDTSTKCTYGSTGFCNVRPGASPWMDMIFFPEKLHTTRTLRHLPLLKFRGKNILSLVLKIIIRILWDPLLFNIEHCIKRIL